MSISSIMGTMIQPVPPTAGAEAVGDIRSDRSGGEPTDFGKALAGALDGVNAQVQAADNDVNAMVRGDDIEIHRVMMSLEKADVSVRLMSQVGRRVVDAYREIIRMNV